MQLTDGMVLYHGSYMPVEHIDLSLCLSGKDFGRGFYVTSDLEQARRFIPNSIRKARQEKRLNDAQTFGYVSSFVFHGNPEDFQYYDFPDADEAWLRFVAYNRGGGNENLLQFIELPDKLRDLRISAEIISGKVANDNTNRAITAYSTGIMGDRNDPDVIRIVINQLMPEKLKDQFCFLTQHAIDSLAFQEVTQYGGNED